MSSISPGTQFGRFRVVRMLAQGGMAEVYRAEQELAEGIWRPAALKVIRPEYSESADFREMFLDEARTACTLAHPNIVHIYEVGEADGRLFMGMELVNGESLSNVARVLRARNERLSDEALLAIGIFTCSALEAVHALELGPAGKLNLVHRDVSPHNLLLAASGALKLIDFGIAKATTNRNLTHAGVTKGKAGYFSPEQAMGKPLDGRSDLFSLGVSLYKLAAGVTPFDEHKNHMDRNTALVHGRWEPLESICPGLPRGLYEVVERSLQVNREDRYADAREMREALEQTAFELGVTVSQSSLLGYVEEHDNEVSVSQVSPVRRRTTHAAKRVTMELPPLASRVRSSMRWKVAVAGAAVLFGVLATGTIALLQREEAQVVEPVVAPEVAVVAPVPVTPTPEVDPLLTPVVAEVPAVEAPAPVVPAVQPVAKKPRVIVAKAAPPRTTPAPIEGGIGKLRMNDPPDFQVTIAGKKNQSPFNVNLPSGLHKASVSSPDGSVKAQCEVPIHPDRPTRLRFDVEAKRCEVN